MKKILIEILILKFTFQINSWEDQNLDCNHYAMLREISYAGSKRCKEIIIQTQNPKSKLQNPNGAVWGRHKKNED